MSVCVSPEVFVCEVGANAAVRGRPHVPINPKANLRLADLLKKPALTSQESQGPFPSLATQTPVYIFQLGVRERVFLIFRPLPNMRDEQIYDKCDKFVYQTA